MAGIDTVINLSNTLIDAGEELHIWRHKELQSANMMTHSHSYYEIELILKGDGINHIKNQDIPIKEGSFYLISPLLSHKVSFSSDIEIITLSFSEKIIKYPKLINDIIFCVRAKDLSSLEMESALVSVRRLEELIKHDSIYKKELISSIFNTLLIDLICSSEIYRPIQLQHDIHKKLKKAIAFISQNLDCNISLADVGEAVGLTANHLGRLFKEQLNTSYTNFITDARLDRAKFFLSDPALSIKEVAKLSGFNSASYFGRCFKEKIGKTPEQFRNN